MREWNEDLFAAPQIAAKRGRMIRRMPPALTKHLRIAPKTKARQKTNVQVEQEMLDRAATHRERGQFREAEQLCVRVLTTNPRNPQALFLSGTLALDQGKPDLALLYFNKALKEKPKDPYYHLALAAAHERINEFERAIKHFHRALALKSDLVGALCGLGATYVKAGRAELALPHYEKALQIDRNHRAVAVGYADALTSLGRMDEALPYLEEAIANRRLVPLAYSVFAGSRTFSSEPAELRAIYGELANPRLAAVEATHLHHAAGKILNDLKRYGEAVDHFQKAKTLAGHDFNITTYRTWVDTMLDLFSPALLEDKAAIGDPSEIPVFILGMPRSGTTLTEQICASHPSVYGAGELTKFPRLAQSIGFSTKSLSAFRESIISMDGDKARELAAEYLSYLQKLSPEGARVIDKMTHNFQLIGLITILFPRARIIHCRRDAIDTCLSCFTTSFNEKHGYNADMQKLGLYYREYDRLMQHWNTVLPGRIYECHYAAMVADQEGETRRLVDYLGLPWDDACLRFYEQRRSVNTPSRWQVRQPIYTSSIKRWKNYEGKIQPLIDALGDLAEI